jgi:hypothetical protein
MRTYTTFRELHSLRLGRSLWLFLTLAALSFAEARDYQMKHPASYYQPENWPQHTLRITKEGNLKEVFDAGFRPYHWPNTRGDVLEFKHSNLTLITSTGKKLPAFPMEYSKIKVKPSGISTLTLIGQSLTIEEAYQEMSQWLPYIGKSEEELSHFLEAVKVDPITYDDRNFGAVPKGFSGGWIDSNGVGYGLRFQQAYNPVVPIRIYVNIGWHRLRTKKEVKTSYRTAPPSPDGYEDYVIEEGGNFGPDSWTEMVHAKGIPFPEGMSLTGKGGKVIEAKEETQPITRPASKPRPKPKVVEEDPPEPEKKSSLPWIIAGVLLLGILALFVKIFKGKSTS